MGSHPLDSAVVGSRYFFPRSNPPPRAHLVSVDGLQCARLHVSDEAPTLLLFHGNGEVVADYFPDMAQAFSSTLGANLFFAEYRGYGGSTGEPALVSMLDDVEALVDACETPIEHIVVFGRSVGSIYGLEAVARRPGIGALVLESGIHDVYERIALRVRPEELGLDDGGLRQAVLERFDHTAKLRAYPGRLLVMHARDDDLVGVNHAEANYAASEAADKGLVRFERGGHNAIFAANAPEYLSRLAAFVAKVRPPGGP